MFDFDALDDADQQRQLETLGENNQELVRQQDMHVEVPDEANQQHHGQRQDNRVDKHHEQRQDTPDVSEIDANTLADLRSVTPPSGECLTVSPVHTIMAPTASPSVIQVQFATLGIGVAVELQLSQEVKGVEVKSMLMTQVKIPVAEQRLLNGLTVWEDACTLGSLCSGLHANEDGPVQITVVRIPIAAHVALSGGRAGNLRVWDIENAVLLKEVHGHKGSVNCVAMQWSMQCALSGGEDKIVRRWDLATGKVNQELTGHSGAINCLAMAWDKGCAVSGSSDKTLRVWNVDKGKSHAQLNSHSGAVTGVALDESVSKAISSSEDRSLLVWDLNTYTVLQQCHGHVSPVHCVSVDQDFRNCASGGWGALKLWRLGGRPVKHDVTTVHLGERGGDGFHCGDLKGHYGPVTCVSIDWDKHRGLSGSADTDLCMWSADARTSLGFRFHPKVLHKHTLPISCLAVDWSASYAVSGGGDCLWVWDLSKVCAIHALRGPEERGEVLCVAIDKR